MLRYLQQRSLFVTLLAAVGLSLVGQVSSWAAEQERCEYEDLAWDDRGKVEIPGLPDYWVGYMDVGYWARQPGYEEIWRESLTGDTFYTATRVVIIDMPHCRIVRSLPVPKDATLMIYGDLVVYPGLVWMDDRGTVYAPAETAIVQVDYTFTAADYKGVTAVVRRVTLGRGGDFPILKVEDLVIERDPRLLEKGRRFPHLDGVDTVGGVYFFRDFPDYDDPEAIRRDTNAIYVRDFGGHGPARFDRLLAEDGLLDCEVAESSVVCVPLDSSDRYAVFIDARTGVLYRARPLPPSDTGNTSKLVLPWENLFFAGDYVYSPQGVVLGSFAGSRDMRPIIAQFVARYRRGERWGLVAPPTPAGWRPFRRIEIYRDGRWVSDTEGVVRQVSAQELVRLGYAEGVWPTRKATRGTKGRQR